MSRSTIKKILKKKHQDFCASIKDERVRRLVKKNSFITGGSIVSLLTNEPVHDYDYYFTDKETVIAVAEYYVKEFENREGDYSAEVVTEDDRVKIFIQSSGIAESEGYNESEEEVESNNETDKYSPVFLSANAITLSNKVQLVIRFYGSPEEVHKNYDFVHCTCYWEAEKGNLVLPADALESIVTKNLRYTGSLYPLCSVIRTRKFIKRGWYINAGQYLKMCFQISELDLADLNILEEQLTGVDALYFHQIISICKNKEKKDAAFKIDSSYLCNVIDKIF